MSSKKLIKHEDKKITMNRMTSTVTTGTTGNIDTCVVNDGTNYVIAPYVSGTSVYLRAWVNPNNNNWYLTAINPNTGDTIKSSQINIRYVLLKLFK